MSERRRVGWENCDVGREGKPGRDVVSIRGAVADSIWPVRAQDGFVVFEVDSAGYVEAIHLDVGQPAKSGKGGLISGRASVRGIAVTGAEFKALVVLAQNKIHHARDGIA